MHKLENLKLWKKSIELTKAIDPLVFAFPNEEKFGLKSQIIRSDDSVESNSAEGAVRNLPKEMNYFLSIANGSTYELQTTYFIE